jgi:hypothetical protein
MRDITRSSPSGTLGPMAGTVFDLHTAAEDLLDCVCAALTRNAVEHPGQPGCPCRRGVVPGQPSWESCDSPCDPPAPDQAGGQLTVNVVRLFDSTPSRFPAEARPVRSLKACEVVVLVAELDITVLRCAPGSDQCPPTPEELQAAAAVLSADMLAVRSGVECCYAGTLVGPRNLRGRRYVLGPSNVVGPQGGCVGFVQRVIVELADPICCPEPEAPTVALQDTAKPLQ